MKVAEFNCVRCGEYITPQRVALGYTTCLSCGEAIAIQRKFTVAPMHKSNYILITDKDDLKGLNNKGGNVR